MESLDRHIVSCLACTCLQIYLLLHSHLFFTFLQLPAWSHVQEDLYSEELAVKTAATAQIGGLFRRVHNLPVLLQHPSLLSVLVRCLREDGRWSLDLSIHILSTFFALSHFSQFHSKLLEIRVGATAMDTLELALRRVDHREVSGRASKSSKQWLFRVVHYQSFA